MVASATPEEWFHRRSGDWNQVRNADKLPGDWSGRCGFGLLGNFDEAYDFLLSLGLLSDGPASKEKAKEPVPECLQQALAVWNQRATKTNGRYGEKLARTISMGITCNMHPAQYIPIWKEARLVATQLPPKNGLSSPLAALCSRMKTCRQISVALQDRCSARWVLCYSILDSVCSICFAQEFPGTDGFPLTRNCGTAGHSQRGCFARCCCSGVERRWS